jgi:hypothetical protein
MLKLDIRNEELAYNVQWFVNEDGDWEAKISVDFSQSHEKDVDNLMSA